MNDLEKIILLSVSSTEPSSFREILSGIGDEAPGNGSTWSDFFRALKSLERDGYIEIDWSSDRKVNSALLTESGVAEARALQIG